MSNPNTTQPNEYESSVNIQTFLVFLLASTIGLLLAVLVLPNWLPNLNFSLGSDAPKAYWYLSRATAFASLSLLWLSMALGMGTTAMAYPHLMAVSTLVALPIILIFIFAQRTFIEGISTTGLKG